MDNNKKKNPHIIIGKNGKSYKYTYPNAVINSYSVPMRNRNLHGNALREQLQNAYQVHLDMAKHTETLDLELESKIGIQVTFESFPDVRLAFESLADAKQKIELLNVKQDEGITEATILIPQNKLSALEKKIEDYLSYKKNIHGNPLDNQKLIDAIQSIRHATLESLWSDSKELYPENIDAELWFEVWLPVLNNRNAVISDIKKIASSLEIHVADNVLEFPERSVLLVKATIRKLASSPLFLSLISEIRKAKETAEFFENLDFIEQNEWVEDFFNRVTVTNNIDSPSICILDTGVNIGHPLISPICDEKDQYTINSDWGPTDSSGHGTGMAGLAAWGDLSLKMDSNDPVIINHRLESVKILRQSGDNEGKHLGNITADGISLPEINNFYKNRVFALALSSPESKDRGKPSSWSATLDMLTCDYLGENTQPRLINVCAGNTGDDLTALRDYPTYNELQDIHDPGQSWNAITIGAYTNKTNITDDGAENYTALAPNGGLSPYSTTSITWDTSMPIKPEVVFEGGNVGIDTYSCAGLDSLKLLTTHHSINQRLFSTFEATSAATALAAKFSAEIYSHYPNLWPETVRALVVHSADWTPEMIQQFQYFGNTERQRAKKIVRVVGYGVPDINKALWSMNNSLAIIIEDELQPFEKKRGQNPSTKDMHIHELPWPKDALLALGHSEVKMTVTLSYFIEPNPSSRNISGKYRYPSHQLRFEVKRPTESDEQFIARISKDARDEEGGIQITSSDPNWLLGTFRNKGSIHKDIWSGTAAELAERGSLVVYPSMGWWRTRTKLEKFNKKARYSLIISIETSDTAVDLYTDILTEIAVKNVANTEVENIIS
ncbi:S8 family peptidase [Aeromonas sanarellii]|uniref:S8 family peptidase n=1 Tax=Aeromonas sanarellii TaxID=633415 RepID=UPI0039A16578